MNINVLKKEQLVTMLVEEHGVDTKTVESLKRPELIEMVKNKIDAAGVLETADMDPIPIIGVTAPEVTPPLIDNAVDLTSTVETRPDPLDADWTQFLIKQLEDSELIEGFPTCDGLRRMFEVYIGEIVNCLIDPIATPSAGNNRATIKCTITYLPHNSRFNGLKNISDVSDCHEANTVLPYSLYMTATAATMAEGRCLRKGLRLKTVSREEVVSTNPTSSIDAALREAARPERSSDNQRLAIAGVSNNLNISLKNMLAYMKNEKIIESIQLDDLSYKEAQEVMRRLTDYERGEENKGLSIPVELYNK